MKYLILLKIFFVLNAAGVLYAQFDIERLPSESAGEEGLAIKINVPEKSRYLSGAPVVIRVHGGIWGEGINDFKDGLAQYGFIEISFNFPGSGEDTYRSGGVYDFRGVDCLKALRDVILFAQGKITLNSGYYLHDVTDSVVPLYNNVGVIGYSNGGNTVMCCAGLFGSSFSDLKYIINWETPAGDGMVTADAGAWPDPGQPSNPALNPAYNPVTGEFDFSTLLFSNDISFKLIDGSDDNDYIGGFYFDINQNKILDAGIDFVPAAIPINFNGTPSILYSEQIISHADDALQPGDTLPAHIPSIQACHSFWIVRNGDYAVNDIAREIPNLRCMIVASDTDHYQSAPDHPHILIQYNSFVNSAIEFVRLNPDKEYVENIIDYESSNLCDNEANAGFDRHNILSGLEPERTLLDESLDEALTIAAACEMADRTLHNNFEPQLDGILEDINDVEFEPGVPGSFILFQNYPNPFNSITTIEYRLPDYGLVKLSVYDLLGNEIETLINKWHRQGRYTLRWNANRCASGVYFCKMTVYDSMGLNYTASKKIILLK